MRKSFKPEVFEPLKTDTNAFPSLVQFVWAGVDSKTSRLRPP